MKTKQLIDRQRILNLATAAKIVVYAPTELANGHFEEVTDEIRLSALSYLISEILNEVGLSQSEILENLLDHSLNGEPVRFASEAVNIGLEFDKVTKAMKENGHETND